MRTPLFDLTIVALILWVIGAGAISVISMIRDFAFNFFGV